MTTATISIHRKIRTQVNFISLPLINWKLIFIAGLFFASLLWIFYAYQINELTRGAYMIKDYNKQIKVLLQESKNLEVNFAESSFLGQVEKKTEELGFKKTTSVKYIQIMDSSFVVAK